MKTLDTFNELATGTSTGALSQAAEQRLWLTAAIIIGGAIFWYALTRLLRSRSYEASVRYRLRKLVATATGTIIIVSLILLWAPFSGRLTVVIGLIGAGIALGLQDVIRGLVGWYQIITGRIYSVGDRIAVGEIRGVVIDITPSRTILMETGGSQATVDWISGRQRTGRIVTIPNLLVTREAVFNYSSHFEFIWEELTFLIPFHENWQRAREIIDAIVTDEIEHIAPRAERQAASLASRYPIDEINTDVRSFIKVQESGISIAVIFIVGVENTRRAQSNITERVLSEFAQEGIRLATPALRIIPESYDTTAHEQGAGER